MKLYLVRHGQTDFNAGGLAQGTIDIPLNAIGEAQARELAKTINCLDFDAYYVSPMLRARQTAAIITGSKANFIVDELLRERNFGEAEGKRIDFTKLGDIYDRRANINAYGMEPIQDLLARAKKFLDQIKTTHAPSDKILIVAHGALLRALHFNIVGYDDDTDFSTARFENCEMREYEV